MFYRPDQGLPCHFTGTRGPHSDATWYKWTKSNHHIDLTYNIFIIVSLKYEHTTFHQENTYEPTILHTTGSRTACPPPLDFKESPVNLCVGKRKDHIHVKYSKWFPTNHEATVWRLSAVTRCQTKVHSPPSKMIFSRLQCEPQKSQKTPRKSKRIARLVQNKLSRVYIFVLYNLYMIFLKDCAPASHIWEQRK